MSTTEETVTTEVKPEAAAEKATPAPKTFKEHYKAAKAAQSTDQGAGEAGDDTTDDGEEKTPAQETEKPADEPTESGEDTNDALLTPEEVSKLSPGDRKLYEKAQKNYTLKTQKLAADRKDIDEWKPLIEGLKDDPATAVEQLAARFGLKVAKADAQDTKTVETKTAETLAELPDDLQFLKPVFEAYGKKLLESVRGEIAPVKEAQDRIVSDAVASETESTLTAFEAKYPGWKKHEAKMLEIGKKFVPAAGSMTDFEYMETLHRLATADITEAEKTKKVVEKINKAAQSVEPTTPAAQDSRVEHALPPPGKRSIKDAYAAAKRGERWTN